MARMPGVPEREAGWLARALFWAARRRMGKLVESWPIVAHAPAILRGWGVVEWQFERARELDAKLKKLAELKVSILVGCPA